MKSSLDWLTSWEKQLEEFGEASVPPNTFKRTFLEIKQN